MPPEPPFSQYLDIPRSGLVLNLDNQTFGKVNGTKKAKYGNLVSIIQKKNIQDIDRS